MYVILSINFNKTSYTCVHIYSLNTNCFCNWVQYIHLFILPNVGYVFWKPQFTRSTWSRQKPPSSPWIQVDQSGATNSSDADWSPSPPSRVAVTCIHGRVSALSSAVSRPHVRSLRTGDKLRLEMNAMTWTKPRNYPSQTQNQPHWAIQDGFRNNFKDNKTSASSVPQEAPASGDDRRICKVNR